ncbi:hypothetical protein W911_04550 [Hyphomicrobium nitrativorans NL23]|uniref:Beta-ketoacyl synthase C-terminal domain-containing protein n=2 Tax=Hyphomicrobium TaxID=81 RepID=V5SJ28_9HYPH|nr:hypothetical protein W911_04550 [Hyphomicrobium nitrativorans NL23]
MRPDGEELIGQESLRTLFLAALTALEPTDIDYINAHRVGTATNDRNETKAIKRVFKDHARRLAVFNTVLVCGPAP